MNASLGLRPDHQFKVIIHSGMRGDAEYIYRAPEVANVQADGFAQRYYHNLHMFLRQSGAELVVEIGPYSVKNLAQTRELKDRTYSQCSAEDLVRSLVEFALRHQQELYLANPVQFNLTPFLDPGMFRCPSNVMPDLSTGLNPSASRAVARILTNITSEVAHYFFTVSAISFPPVLLVFLTSSLPCSPY